MTDIVNDLYEGREEDFWTELCESVFEGNLVVVLGHECAMLSDGSNLYQQLATVYLDESDSMVLGERNDWPRVASLYLEKQSAPKTRRNEICLKVGRMGGPGKLHWLLARLPISNFILTSPDRLLKMALSDGTIYGNFRRSPKEVMWDRARQSTPETDLDKGSIARPLLFYLCGRHDQPSSVLLTEEERMRHLIDFTKLFEGDSVFPTKLKQHYQAGETRFLFLGWGLDQYGQRLIVQQFRPESAVHREHPPRSLAIDEGFWATSSPRWSRHVFSKRFGVHVFHHDVLQFLEKFEAKLHAKQRVKKVFISHSSADKETFVSPFVEFLWNRGIFPWFDQEQISTESKLNESITKAIDCCDVFVSLISENWLKPCRYANDECRYANDERRQATAAQANRRPERGITVALAFAYRDRAVPNCGDWELYRVIEAGPNSTEWMEEVYRRIIHDELSPITGIAPAP